MIQLWKTKKQFFLRHDMGIGSPAWDHWVTLLTDKNGKNIRIELYDMESEESKCGKYKLVAKFKNKK